MIQRFRCGAAADDTATAEDVATALGSGHPVIATLCYGRPAAIPAVAAQRSADCFSVAAIGVVELEGEEYLVARDGLGEADACEASADRVKPKDVRLPLGEHPWSQPGTSLYRWAGANTNVVVTMVSSLDSDGRP